jgi:hypothetical protein
MPNSADPTITLAGRAVFLVLAVEMSRASVYAVLARRYNGAKITSLLADTAGPLNHATTASLANLLDACRRAAFESSRQEDKQMLNVLVDALLQTEGRQKSS